MHVARRYENSLLNVFLLIEVVKSNTLRIEVCKGCSDGFLNALGYFGVFEGGGINRRTKGPLFTDKAQRSQLLSC